MLYNLNRSVRIAHGCYGMQLAKMLATDTSVVFQIKLELRIWSVTVAARMSLLASLLK